MRSRFRESPGRLHVPILSHLQVPPWRSQQFPPVFISKPDPQTVYVGKRAVMQCVIAGTAPLNVVWLKDNQALPKVPAHYQSSCEKNNFATLHIIKLEQDDAGLYECRVSNNVGSKSCQTAITLKG
uniref:Ig-like domain-containing protein n=1 Tax=Pundamilia nyererei TaxID=303518 RepID=A0A3B4H932_9CICH